MSLSDAELSWLEEYSDCLLSVCTHSISDSDYINRFVQSNKNRFGPTHQNVAATLTLAGTAYLFAGDFDSVQRSFKEARKAADLAIDEWVLNSIHIAALCGLVATNLNAKNFDEANFFAEKIQNFIPGSQAEKPETFWKVQLLLAEMYFLQEKFDVAYDYFFSAAVTYNKLPRNDDDIEKLAYLQGRLAITQYLRGEFEDAIKILQSVLTLRDEFNLPNTPLFIACANLISKLYQQTGDDQKVEVYLNFALAGAQEYYGMTDAITCECLNYIANYFMNLNDWSKAFEFLQESISWIDKRFDPEQTIWVLDGLITITSLLENFDLQERYVEIMTDIYSKELNGDFMSDRSLVEKGDQGAALKRQEKYQSIVDRIKAGYDSELHPQVKAALGAVDPSVWTGPILEVCREYAFFALSKDAGSASLPISDSIRETRDMLLQQWSELDFPAEPAWQQAVTERLAENKHTEAIALLEAFRQHEEATYGPRSRSLIPLMETLSNLYGVKAGQGAARYHRIYAILLDTIQ